MRPCLDAGAGCVDHFFHQGACDLFGGGLGTGQELRELTLDDARHQALHGWGPKHLLRLALELGFRQPDGDHCGQALQAVVFHDLLSILEEPGPVERLGEGLRHAPLKTGDVGAALGSGDDVDE